MTISNIPKLTVKRPNGFEYCFDCTEDDKSIKIFRTYKQELTLTELDEKMEELLIVCKDSLKTVEEVVKPDLENAALAIIISKALSTSVEIPPELKYILDIEANKIAAKSGIVPDLGVSATVATQKLIDSFQLKGDTETVQSLQQLLQFVSSINGGII